MKQETNTFSRSAVVLARLVTRLSPALRRAALLLLLAVMTSVTVMADILPPVCEIEVFKAGAGHIFVQGWAYDPYKKDWKLDIGIVVSRSQDVNDYPAFWGVEDVERPDINESEGLTGIHGFKQMIEIIDNDITTPHDYYVRIRAVTSDNLEYTLFESSINVYPFLGQGTEMSPITIRHKDDWNKMIDLMADDDMGPYYADKYYMLDDDFNNTSTPVNRMFGTATRPFAGTFNGNGKTLNVNLSGTERVAPFAYTDGVTIQNLTVAGTINATQSAGGIVGYAANTLTLESCACGATISGFSQFAGGLLGWCDDLTLTMGDCLFKGAFSPADGGKYHLFACKNASKTVTMSLANSLYYLNTATSSEGLGKNCITETEGTPVSTTPVDGVWNERFVAADGQPYYRTHYNGSEEDPHLIYDADQWNNLADAIADDRFSQYFSDRCYRLADNFDNTTAVTTMFGTATHPFTGTFDGNGQTLNVNLSGTEHVAPFAYTDGASIQNLTVAGTINATQSAGGIVGYAANTLTLKSCACGATISGFSQFAGGLLGWCDNLTLTMSNCLFKGVFSPADGGKYQLIACKNASKKVTMTPAFNLYYIKTLAPSERMDDNCIIGAEGIPVSETLEADEWDDPILAADGITYYGVHYDGKYLPYDYGFETPLDEDGWMMADCIDLTGLREINHSGNYSFFFLWTSYPSEQHYQYLISPKLDNRSGIKMTFYYNIHRLTAGCATFQVGYSTTTPDIDAFNWDNGTTTSIKQWLLYEGSFPKGTKYIAVKWHPNKYGYLYLDDFSFTACNTPSPTQLCVGDDITENTASLTWEAPFANNTITGYTYQYKKASDTDWSAETTVDATSVTLTGLTANTDYQFRVKALYGEDESVYVPVNFTTAMELPYDYGFENGMNRWSRMDDAWGYTGISEKAKHEGEKGYFFNSYITSPQYLISPRFAGTQPLTVSFYYKDSEPDSGFWETFYVGYSTTTSDPDAFKWGDAIYATNIPWTGYEQTFPAGTRFIAVKYTSSYTVGLYIDDFSVAAYSTFPKPTDITVSNLTDSGAKLSWTAPDGNVTGFAYQYRKATDEEWSAETTVQTTTVTLSNLEENMTYNFRVKALGSGGIASNYAIGSFHTDGSVVNLPYIDSFENGMGGWRMKDCHQSTEINTIYAQSGEHSFYFHSTSNHQYLISPHFAGGTPMKVSFYYRNVNPDYPAKFFVGYASSKTNPIIVKNTMEAIDGEWTLYEAFFPAEAQYVVIGCLAEGYMLHLDDFSFTPIPEIDLADQTDNSQTIIDNKDEEALVTLQGRTLHLNSQWQTLCLPFDVSSFLFTPLAGATVKTLGSTSFSNGTLTLNFEDATSIEAGKPYIVNWADAAYLTINSTEDWDAFAESVNRGKSYAGKTVMLRTPITISTMVGTAEHPFDGIFEGDNKRLDINISNGGNGAAPFRYIKDATIKNVRTIGSVSGGNYSAGLVGFASGTNTICNCMVETDVDVSTYGGEYVGGILGNGTSSTTTIRDCMYNGDLHGLNFGMLYGWGEAGGTHTIKNCMSYAYCFLQDGSAADLMLVAPGGTCNVINCYKYNDYGTQGTYWFTFGSDESVLAERLGDQWTINSNDGTLAIHKTEVTTVAYTNSVNPAFLGVTVSDATVNVGTDYADFLGSCSPFASTEGLLFDEYNPNNGACRGALRLANLNDAAFDGWYTDAELTTPVTTIPFAADGTVTLYTKATKPLVKGDVNGDGKVTPADAIMILYHYFGVVQNDFNKSAADLNGDSHITPADAIEALYKYFGSSSNNARRARPTTTDEPMMVE
jgi:hypothetical protein